MEIKLQGIYNPLKAVHAKDLKIGDITVWNYGYKEKVLGITFTKSHKSVRVKILSIESGEDFTRTLRVNRLVAVEIWGVLPLFQVRTEEKKVDELTILKRAYKETLKMIEKEREFNATYFARTGKDSGIAKSRLQRYYADEKYLHDRIVEIENKE